MRFAFVLLLAFFTVGGNAQIMQLAELTASDGAAHDTFGYSVAMSGNTAVVGAPSLFYDNAGAAYVFVNSGSGWQQTAKLLPPNSSNGDLFGYSVAISGDMIVVGGPKVSVTPSQTGGAFLFVGSAGNWRSVAGLIPSDQTAQFAFGSSVNLSGNTVVVGAPQGPGPCLPSEAYLYVNPTGRGDTITQTARLSPSDGAACGEFGNSVSVAGNTVVVGAPYANNREGTAYLYVKPQSGWTDMTETAELTGSDLVGPDEFFGTSVAINSSTNTVVTGVLGHNLGHGAAYVFVEPVGGWASMTQSAELNSSGTSNLGNSVVINGDDVLAGADYTDIGGNEDQGEALVFVKPMSGWETTFHANVVLTAADGWIDDELGASVGLGSAAIAGAPFHTVNGNQWQGVAYVFGLAP